jgi:hypothetical protein
VKKDWLFQFLSSCVRAFRDEESEARVENFRRDHHDWPRDELIRRWVEFRLRQTGVVYGTPLASEETIAFHTAKGYPQRRAVFLAILAAEAELAMEVGCAVSHCTVGNIRACELLVCFALLCREFKLAENIHELVPLVPAEGEVPEKLLRCAGKVGRVLPRRAYLSGNPLIGLPIHNSFNYVDAKTLGRIAVAYYERGCVDRQAIKRVLDYKDREKEHLLRAMVGLTLADRPLGVGSLRVVRQQIGSSGLPRKFRKALRRMLKQPASPMAVAAAVKDDRTRDFILEQVILGATLDGHFSEGEKGYVGDLAGFLGVSPEELARLEAEVVAFYETHKAYLDLFMVGTAVRSYRQRLPEQLQQVLRENLSLITKEIKAKKGLADLLYRASLGEDLTREERQKMGRQLVDILRTFPSLAIFSIPGGAVLLPLLFKILPKGLKPRAFAEVVKKEGGREII